MSAPRNRPAQRGRRALSGSGAALIAGAAALHALWGTGSAWPARDRRDLADAVAGTPEFPGPAACSAVAILLGGAAVVVARGARGPGGRLAVAGIAGGFAIRGVAGVTGAARWLATPAPSDRFVALDRRYYGPLCLTIAALVAADL